MLCPYRNFEECDWKNCAARMYVEDPCNYGYQMRVCALAYKGAPIPASLVERCEASNE